MDVKNAYLVNLINHEITIEKTNNARVSYAAAKVPATVRTRQVGSFAGVPILDAYGEVEGLPEPRLNTMFIVSRTVRQALDDLGIERIDVVVPAEPIYEYIDGKKVVRACRALSR